MINPEAAAPDSSDSLRDCVCSAMLSLLNDPNFALTVDTRLGEFLFYPDYPIDDRVKEIRRQVLRAVKMLATAANQDRPPG